LKPKGFQSRYATADGSNQRFEAPHLRTPLKDSVLENPAKGSSTLWNPFMTAHAPSWEYLHITRVYCKFDDMSRHLFQRDMSAFDYPA